MGKLKSLITGALLGAGSMYVGLQYHVLMAPEGMLLVPRSPQARLQDAYADVSSWDATTWAARPQVSLAVTNYGRADLITQGATQGVLDKLRNTFSPAREQLGEASSGWEPVDGIDVPAPNNGHDGSGSVAEEPPARRGFLPLADLFDFDEFADEEADRDIERSILPESESRTNVMPAARTTPKEVEFLPPPDDFDLGGNLDSRSDTELGAPGQFPDELRNRPRQTDASPILPEQSAEAIEEGDWEPLSLLPDEMGEQSIVR